MPATALFKCTTKRALITISIKMPVITNVDVSNSRKKISCEYQKITLLNTSRVFDKTKKQYMSMAKSTFSSRLSIIPENNLMH